MELQRLKRGAPQRAGDRARRTDSDESPASGWRHHDHAQTSNRRPSQRSRSQAEEPRSPFSLDEETVGKPILKGTDECSKPHKNDALLVQTKSVSSSSAEKPDRLLKSQEATSAIDTGKEESISFDWYENIPFSSFHSFSSSLACLLTSARFVQSSIKPGGLAT